MSTTLSISHSDTVYRDQNPRQPLSSPSIINIKQSTESVKLEQQIIEGLRSEPKFIPSVLLWNDDGLRLFDEVTCTPHYYPNSTEIDLLNSHADDIAKTILSNSVVIELGSGNLKKTMIFLKALVRQRKVVRYYALDLNERDLRQSLSNLVREMGHSPYIRCEGLVGSYEDVAVWLQQTPDVASKPKSYLWLGNSIANHPPQEAASLLASLVDIPSGKEDGVRPSFIIAVDNCRDPSVIDRAYSVSKGQCGEFISTSLRHVDSLANREVFKEEEWALKGVYEERDRCFRSYCVAQTDLILQFAGEEFPIARGEHIRAMQSWKWDLEQIRQICTDARLQCRSTWQHERPEYGIYLLEPAE